MSPAPPIDDVPAAAAAAAAAAITNDDDNDETVDDFATAAFVNECLACAIACHTPHVTRHTSHVTPAAEGRLQGLHCMHKATVCGEGRVV